MTKANFQHQFLGTDNAIQIMIDLIVVQLPDQPSSYQLGGNLIPGPPACILNCTYVATKPDICPKLHHYWQGVCMNIHHCHQCKNVCEWANAKLELSGKKQTRNVPHKGTLFTISEQKLVR